MFTERAVLMTFHFAFPKQSSPTLPALDEWSDALDQLFAPAVDAFLPTEGIPNAEPHRTRVLVLAMMDSEGSEPARVRRAARFYKQSGLIDMTD